MLSVVVGDGTKDIVGVEGNTVQVAVAQDTQMHHAIGLRRGRARGRTVRTPSDTVPTNLSTDTLFAAMVAIVCLSGPMIRAGVENSD